MHPPKKQPLGNLPEGAVQGELREQHVVGIEVEPERPDALQHRSTHQAVLGVAQHHVAQQLGEALAGAGGSQVEAVLVVAEHAPVLVDQRRLRIRQDDGWLAVEHLHAARDGLRRGQVIAREPAKVFPARQLERMVVVPRGTEIALLADVADPSVPPRVGARDRLGPIG